MRLIVRSIICLLVIRGPLMEALANFLNYGFKILHEYKIA